MLNLKYLFPVALVLMSACKKDEQPKLSNSESAGIVSAGFEKKVPVAGNESPAPAELAPATQKPVPLPEPLPAKVKYLSQTVKDANNNGVIDPGEKIVVSACVQNVGKGRGRDLSVSISAETLVPAMDDFSIWPVEPGEIKCFPVEFWVPSKAGGTYVISYAFSDGTKKDFSLAVVARAKTASEIKSANEESRIKNKAQKAFDDLN